MYKNSLDVIEFEKWNRKILNVFWLIIIIATITEIIVFFLVPVKRGCGSFSYFMSYVLKPTLFNIVLLSITELAYKFIKDKFKEFSKYLIIIAATLLACNLVYIHYSVSVIYVVFIFPIMLSVYYGSKRIAFFSLTINLISYLLMVLLYLPTKSIENTIHTTTDICTTIAFIISTLLLIYSFINRSKEIIKSFIDIHESEQELTIKTFIMEFNSKIEPVTGLYNHKTFYEYLENLIEQSENFQFPISLAVLDIDNFKRVNDTYGHSLGDDVIKTLAEVIKSYIGTDDYASRYGGEEFAIIFTDRDKYKTLEIMEIIRTKFNSITINGMKDERFSVSIGVSEHHKGMSKHTLFTNADKALYKAKKTGKNKTITH